MITASFTQTYGSTFGIIFSSGWTAFGDIYHAPWSRASSSTKDQQQARNCFSNRKQFSALRFPCGNLPDTNSVSEPTRDTCRIFGFAVSYGPWVRVACIGVMNCCNAISCSEIHSKLATFCVIRYVDLRSIPKCSVHCLQNPDGFPTCCTSTLVVRV